MMSRSKMQGLVRADVRISERMDRVVIVPRERNDMLSLHRILSQSLPDDSFQRAGYGIQLRSENANSLLTDLPGLDLRWSPEARQVAENREGVRRVHERVQEEIQRILDGGTEVARACLPRTSRLEILDDHQLVNVAAMTVENGFGLCVFDEQGTGKTVTGIFAFDVLAGKGEVDSALILAPKNMLSEWKRDFERFTGGLYTVEVAVDGRQAKRTVIRNSPDVLVTNFETAVSMEADLSSMLRRQRKPSVLLVDESFFVKNLDARRTQAVRRLREFCGRAFVLCGTPAPNSPHDLVEQFNIVDFGMTFGDLSIPEDRNGATRVVRRAMEDRGLFTRNIKDEVLPDLPPRRFSRILMPLAPKQEVIYRNALDGLITDLSDTSEADFRRRLTSFLARRTALLRICSNPSPLDPSYEEIPAKLKALDEILHQLIIEQREKVVLWSFYTASIDALERRYGAFSTVRFDGTIASVSERADSVRRFQDDEATMLFIGNPAAAGAGLTLHRSRYAIYESMSNQAAHYLQSLDRVHRRGQDRDVEYLVLLCDQTIEVREYQRLLDKQDRARDLLGDPDPRHVTREAMLDEAQALCCLMKGNID